MSPEYLPMYPEEFIMEPDQKRKQKYKKRIFREKIRSLPWPYSFLYLTGDLFPSVKWMKSRYKCSMTGAIIRYPHRLGKLLWLI
jgi:hypothetical protein